MALQEDAGEDIGMRRRRLRYRAWHRGMRELDLLLGPYADAEAERMDSEAAEQFERLLAEEDTSLQAWLLGRETIPPEYAALMADLAVFHATGAQT